MTCEDAHHVTTGRWDRGDGSYVKNGKRAWPVQERERTKRELARPKRKEPQEWIPKLNRWSK